MTKEKQIQFLNFLMGDDMDFYEEYVINLSNEEQQIFFRENPEFMSDYAINKKRIVLLRDKLYRGVLRKIKLYEEEQDGNEKVSRMRERNIR